MSLSATKTIHPSMELFSGGRKMLLMARVCHAFLKNIDLHLSIDLGRSIPLYISPLSVYMLVCIYVYECVCVRVCVSIQPPPRFKTRT